ncbi:hypothetical protein ACA910_013729 [Epithemia clementina (nom. ined.)]
MAASPSTKVGGVPRKPLSKQHVGPRLASRLAFPTKRLRSILFLLFRFLLEYVQTKMANFDSTSALPEKVANFESASALLRDSVHIVKK